MFDDDDKPRAVLGRHPVETGSGLPGTSGRPGALASAREVSVGSVVNIGECANEGRDNATSRSSIQVPSRKRLRVPVSAYACEPNVGSEPGAGWNLARLLAETHEIWVIARADHRSAIEAELRRNPLPGAKFLYHRIPLEMGEIWYRKPLIYFHYYLWQVSLYFLVSSLHRRIGFELVHHVTYARYWTPNTAAFLGVPFLFGPVGSGEGAPPGFVSEFALRDRLTELLRNSARVFAGFDPLVRATVRRAATVLATTRETESALRRMGARDVRLCPDMGMTSEDMAALAAYPIPDGPLRLITVSRLIAWKGIHLGLRAFAAAGIPDGEYWVIGEGPEGNRLRRLARELGVEDRVHFLGRMSRLEVFAKLARCHAMVHPSLHDTGGWACVEAMAAGRPVLCLDWGGPALNVTSTTGWRIFPHSPEQVVRDMADVMRRVESDRTMLAQFSKDCRKHVERHFCWPERVSYLCDLYEEIRGDLPRHSEYRH